MAAAERERHHARGARAVDERTTERMMADALQWWEAVWDRDL